MTRVDQRFAASIPTANIAVTAREKTMGMTAGHNIARPFSVFHFIRTVRYCATQREVYTAA